MVRPQNDKCNIKDNNINLSQIQKKNRRLVLSRRLENFFPHGHKITARPPYVSTIAPSSPTPRLPTSPPSASVVAALQVLPPTAALEDAAAMAKNEVNGVCDVGVGAVVSALSVEQGVVRVVEAAVVEGHLVCHNIGRHRPLLLCTQFSNRCCVLQ